MAVLDSDPTSTSNEGSSSSPGSESEGGAAGGILVAEEETPSGGSTGRPRAREDRSQHKEVARRLREERRTSRTLEIEEMSEARNRELRQLDLDNERLLASLDSPMSRSQRHRADKEIRRQDHLILTEPDTLNIRHW